MDSRIGFLQAEIITDILIYTIVLAIITEIMLLNTESWVQLIMALWEMQTVILVQKEATG